MILNSKSFTNVISFFGIPIPFIVYAIANSLAHHYNIVLPHKLLLLLALFSWLIYLTDHLIDQLSQKESHLTQEKFYIEFSAFLSISLVTLCSFLFFKLSRENMLQLTQLAIPMIAYFILNAFLKFKKKKFWIKELCIALIFSFGIHVPIYIQSEKFLLTLKDSFPTFSTLSLLVLLNLIIISIKETTTADIKKESDSFVNQLSIRTKEILYLLTSISIFSLLAQSNRKPFHFVTFFVSCLQGCILINKKNISTNKYRLLADMSFILFYLA